MKYNKKDWLLLFLNAFSWETDLWVTIGDIMVKTITNKQTSKNKTKAKQKQNKQKQNKKQEQTNKSKLVSDVDRNLITDFNFSTESDTKWVFNWFYRYSNISLDLQKQSQENKQYFQAKYIILKIL